MSAGNRKDRETIRIVEPSAPEPYKIEHYGWRGRPFAEELEEVLVGHSIDRVEGEDTLVLDNGVRLQFDRYNSSCCSSIDLVVLRATHSNVITKVTVADNEDETGYEGPYKAWITVLTEAEELNIAEADGNASNGYYLHGFALDVTVIPPKEDA
jgi:hypothetical protein